MDAVLSGERLTGPSRRRRILQRCTGARPTVSAITLFFTVEH
jgi:hypothetical protein